VYRLVAQPFLPPFAHKASKAEEVGEHPLDSQLCFHYPIGSTNEHVGRISSLAVDKSLKTPTTSRLLDLKKLLTVISSPFLVYTLGDFNG
jgi:hypothetical protein